jgi:hypothetical protein
VTFGVAFVKLCGAGYYHVIGNTEFYSTKVRCHMTYKTHVIFIRAHANWQQVSRHKTCMNTRMNTRQGAHAMRMTDSTTNERNDA